MARTGGSWTWQMTWRAMGIAAGIAGAGLFLGVVYLGLTWDLRPAAEELAAGFRAARVEQGHLRETVVATGRIEPYARIVVQSEIPGIVGRVYVDDGDRVTREAPLVELDRERLEDRRAELVAALDHRSALARVRLVRRARAELDKHRRDLARHRRLHEAGVVSQQRLDEITHAVALAEIALADARAEENARGAAVREAEHQLRRIERDLAKATIRAPVEGVVVRREVEVGTAVADLQNGGTVVAVLADDRQLHVLAEVDENDVAGVAEGQLAEVRIDAFPGEVFEGRLRKVSSSGSGSRVESISSFEVEIAIDPDRRIRVGMSADARIVVGEHRDALLVPNTAIVRDEDGSRLRVPDANGGFELRAVRELYSDGFRTVVDEVNEVDEASSLSPGDVVLVRADGPDRWQP